MEKPVFITTSIAYINTEPHIGFLFELLSADVLARYFKLQGKEVFFLTGTDEHGSKIEQKAKELHKDPQQHADEISAKFQQLGKDFAIDFDYFVRTTNPEHIKFVQEKWKILQEKGALEKRKYKGYYCVGCEEFKNERELINNCCPIHEKPVEIIEEENWFFLLSKYKGVILEWLESGDVIYPESKRNELRNMLDGLEDISFSRSKEKLSWGIPVPGDEGQVMYVWADALLNYLSGIELSGKKIEEVWPADIQIIGKDILKFHAAIWPAMLHVLGYELPKKLLVHGFINVDGKKLSKSSGHIVYPQELLERYGVDATRYLLFRQFSFYDDSNFVWDEFDAIYNGELANGIGNLVGRTVGLSRKVGVHNDFSTISITREGVMSFDIELQKVNELVKEADKIITENKLWEGLAENSQKQEMLQSVAKKCWEVSLYLEPFMPETAKEIRHQLTELDSRPLFPRLQK